LEVTTFKTKTVKVRITSEVSTYLYEGHQYSPGDTLTIPESLFTSYIMEKVEEEKKKKTTPKLAETTSFTEELTETTVPTPKPKPRARRTKTA
jgi:hypothetical protein